MSKDFKEEFNKFKHKLETKQPFAFSRFSDGELFILKNERVVLGSNFFVTGQRAGANVYTPEEQKHFDPEHHPHVHNKLKECLQYVQKGYFKGLSGKVDVGEEDFDLQVKLSNEQYEGNLTFANLFINANYKKFIEEIVAKIFPKYDILYVVNERADLSGLPFNVKKRFNIGSNCMVNNFDITEEIKDYIRDNKIENHLILCSAASLSNFVIYECFKEFPSNTYLDIGSALNPYLGSKMEGWKHTRDYLRAYWFGEKNRYGEQIDVW